MAELIVGIFLILFGVIIILFVSGGMLKFILAISFICLALFLIFRVIKKMLLDRSTSLHGEECYAKVLECVPTETILFGKEEYKVVVAVYVSSINKTLLLEESIGYGNYQVDSYISVLYYNGDINIIDYLNEDEVPSDILKKLNDESVINEYAEDKKIIEQNEQKAKEIMENKVIPVAKRVEDLKTTSSLTKNIISMIVAFIFSLIVILISPYFGIVINLVKKLPENIITLIILLILPIINLLSIPPMILCNDNSKKKAIFALIYFLSIMIIIGCFIFF